MTETCWVDGRRIKVESNVELDVGESMTNVSPQLGGQGQQGMIDVKEPSELGEVLKQLNDDSPTGDTSMSGIDMRSRLKAFEIPPLMAVDVMVALKFLPRECLGLTRQKKRLAVSLDGLGRDDIVKIVNGEREQEQKKGGLFNPQNWGNKGT